MLNFTNKTMLSSTFLHLLLSHCVIKFVSDLRQVGVFSLYTPVSSTNKTDRHNIAEILLKVALITNQSINHTDDGRQTTDATL
jgi:hypothetical protein